MKTLFILHFNLCCLGSSGALLLDHNRLLALQNSAGTSQGSLEKQRGARIRFCDSFKVHFPPVSNTHHTQVLPVFVLADDVPQAAQGGAGVLVDGDLFVGGGRFVLTCATNISN